MAEFYKEYVQPILNEMETELSGVKNFLAGVRLAHDLPSVVLKTIEDVLQKEQVLAECKVTPAPIPKGAQTPDVKPGKPQKVKDRKPLGPEAQDEREKIRQRRLASAKKQYEKMKGIVGERLTSIDINHKVPLTRNERKRIIAAVASCESAGDFGAINSDTEFNLSKERAKELGVSYNGVVHIGLSWGIIQYTQDSGELGILLKRMHQRDPAQFESVFGNNWKELLEVTNSNKDTICSYIKDSSGMLATEEDEENVDVKIGPSALSSWKKLKPDAKNSLKEQQIQLRSSRVQPIAIHIGGPKQDLWVGKWRERFQEAGRRKEFCEVQLERGVERYLNPLLKDSFKSKEKEPINLARLNVVSALGIAYITACYVRGAGSTPFQSFLWALDHAGVGTTLDGHHEEEDVIRYIVAHAGEKGESPAKDEGRRAELLLFQACTFLDVKEYDVNTYDNAHDR